MIVAKWGKSYVQAWIFSGFLFAPAKVGSNGSNMIFTFNEWCAWVRRHKAWEYQNIWGNDSLRSQATLMFLGLIVTHSFPTKTCWGRTGWWAKRTSAWEGRGNECYADYWEWNEPTRCSCYHDLHRTRLPLSVSLTTETETKWFPLNQKEHF